jgi:gliding motility-associated-like protein
MPHRWGGITFGSEVTDYPIYISINDTCDSIILYTLVVIKHWGEPPLDSTFILVPNIFTPGQETNNRFKIVANKFILEAQVNLFDRRGVKVAEFDGLTGDWDGTHDGIPLPQGSYIYYIRYRDTSVNGWKNLKGTVTLIR